MRVSQRIIYLPFNTYGTNFNLKKLYVMLREYKTTPVSNFNVNQKRMSRLVK